MFVARPSLSSSTLTVIDLSLDLVPSSFCMEVLLGFSGSGFSHGFRSEVGGCLSPEPSSLFLSLKESNLSDKSRASNFFGFSLSRLGFSLGVSREDDSYIPGREDGAPGNPGKSSLALFSSSFLARKRSNFSSKSRWGILSPHYDGLLFYTLDELHSLSPGKVILYLKLTSFRLWIVILP